MRVERLWFVVPLNLTSDPNKPSWGPEMGVNEEGFAQPAPRRDRDAGRFRVGDRLEAAVNWGQQEMQVQANPANIQAAPQAQMLKGRGFFLSSESRKKFEKGFTTEEMAIEEAKKQAELFPKVPFGVFSCIAIFETTTPKIIEKTFNDAGELRVK